jgi:RNA polymerase sigma-70 factor, ECF subfamily
MKSEIPETTDLEVTREHFKDVVGRYGRYVYTITYRILGNRGDAEDASQETFVKAFRNLDRYDRALGPKNWLCTIALNTARDFYRRSRRHRKTTGNIPDIENLVDGTDTVSDADSRLDVQKVLGFLDIKYRIVMVLFYMEQYEVKEIAALLKKSTTVIKVRLFRARKIIMERFGALLI